MGDLLKGRVAVVTGGGRGLGRAIALRLAKEGASVLVNDLGAELDGTGVSHQPADAVTAEITAQGGRAAASYHDVSDYRQAGQIMDEAVQRFGRLDILVNSVGNARPKLMTECSQQDFDTLIDVMLKGKLYCTQHAGKRMAQQGSGRIISLASNIGLIQMTRRTGYAAAQVGIIGFGTVAAGELGPYGVTVNTLCPGATESRLIRDAMRVAKAHLDHPIIDAAERGTAAQNPAPPDNLAEFATYLCTDAAANINGQTFYVAGGQIARVALWALPSMVHTVSTWTQAELAATIPATIMRAIPNPAPPMPRKR
jgi:NAD(P)-dependent dehydrogenase (short-subunit alcohol dehydrogenase family)